jgi:putative ABC transport system permease protein
MRLIMGQGEAIVVAGAVVGLAVFLVFSRLLASLVYDVRAVDAASVAIAVAGLIAVATIATWIPARRAARIDPAEALRAE